MPDGSDAWSDYGIEPLWKIFEEYRDDLPPEKVLALVNRALDVYHQRGDMASIFIQGGSQALSRIAEEIERKGKKIYITEKQIIKLKNG
jgi:putative cell wall-binding protein